MGEGRVDEVHELRLRRHNARPTTQYAIDDNALKCKVSFFRETGHLSRWSPCELIAGADALIFLKGIKTLGPMQGLIQG